MKTLIAYASKSGTAKRCAELLHERIPDSTLCDLLADLPDPAAYDRIVVGSGVRMGRIHKHASAFLTQYADVIAARPHAFFITNSFTAQSGSILEASFPEALRNTARAACSLGGMLDLAALRGADRLIAKMVAGSAAGQQNETSNGIDEAKLAALAQAVMA